MSEIAGKYKKILGQNMWYHGTVFSNWESFCKNGIIADFNRDTSDALDFGYGFYLAPSKERAEHFIMSMIKNSSFYSPDDKPMILGFEFTPLEWFEGEEYNTKILGSFDDEFAVFVFENRTENVMGSKQHNYDVIYGVMSDAIPVVLIANYKMGTITKEEVLDGLKKW